MRQQIRKPRGRQKIVVDRFSGRFRVRSSYAVSQLGTYCSTSEEVVDHIRRNYGDQRHNGRDAYSLEVDVVPQCREDALRILNSLTGKRDRVYPKS
ncbi:MAG: hypothetical protein HZB67_05170 [Candidatus Aenigmarchaeota archaeon]|nr:hypothetical protein [Candidatus Aenigmarchaeota archaeon]